MNADDTHSGLLHVKHVAHDSDVPFDESRFASTFEFHVSPNHALLRNSQLHTDYALHCMSYDHHIS